MPVQVEGLRQTVRSLEQAGVAVADLKAVMSRIAAEAAESAARFAPTRSGKLRASIRGNKAKGKAVVTAGNKGRVPYAGAINYGWPRRGIAAQGFMQKADAEMQDKAIAMLEDGLDEILSKEGLV